MKQTIYIPFVATALFLAGCNTQKSANGSATALHPEAEKLQIRMEPALAAMTNSAVPIAFIVINKTGKPLSFCKWETPFEPRLGKYFQITNSQGKEADFKGAMARRVMPPPADAYIKVAAHDSVKTIINLADNYTLPSGTYHVKYTGGGVSGLKAGKTITLKF